jgi:hypothetical protein
MGPRRTARSMHDVSGRHPCLERTRRRIDRRALCRSRVGNTTVQCDEFVQARAHTVDYGARSATAQRPAPRPSTMRELVVTAESRFACRIGASLVGRRTVT